MIIAVIWKFIRSVVTFVMEHWKYFVVGGASAFVIFQLQNFRVTSLKTELAEVKAINKILVSANKEYEKTVLSLQESKQKLKTSYELRIKDKDKLIADIKLLCITPEGGGNENSNNQLIDIFNGLWLLPDNISPK